MALFTVSWSMDPTKQYAQMAVRVSHENRWCAVCNIAVAVIRTSYYGCTAHCTATQRPWVQFQARSEFNSHKIQLQLPPSNSAVMSGPGFHLVEGKAAMYRSDLRSMPKTSGEGLTLPVATVPEPMRFTTTIYYCWYYSKFLFHLWGLGVRTHS